jgi:hypothetical protein
MTDPARYGPWALVTGASSGIGAAFARRLAALGFRLVLTARREAALQDIARGLGGESRVVPLDLSGDGAAARLADAVAGLDVGLVVSNAGTGIPGAFVKSDPEAERAVRRLNIEAPTELARAFTPRLLARGRGGLILVSSTLAFQGTPYLAAYAAAKAYLLVLGESLHEELKPAGVDVVVLAPGATETPAKRLYPVDFSKVPAPWMAPEAVVEAALAGLGRKAVVIPGIRNRLLACLGSGLWTRRRVSATLAEFARRALPPDRI